MLINSDCICWWFKCFLLLFIVCEEHFQVWIIIYAITGYLFMCSIYLLRHDSWALIHTWDPKQIFFVPPNITEFTRSPRFIILPWHHVKNLEKNEKVIFSRNCVLTKWSNAKPYFHSVFILQRCYRNWYLEDATKKKKSVQKFIPVKIQIAKSLKLINHHFCVWYFIIKYNHIYVNFV